MKSMLRLAALGLYCTCLTAVSAQDNVVNWCEPPKTNCTDEKFEVEFSAPVAGTSIWEYDNFVANTQVDIFTVMNTVNPEVAGWSYSIVHESEFLTLTEDSVTTAGTVTADKLVNPFFDVTNAVPGGWISAIVLSFITKAELPPGERNTIAKASYTLIADPGTEGTLLRFASGEIGAPGSPPTSFNITVGGNARQPSQLVQGLIRKSGGQQGNTQPGNDVEVSLSVDGVPITVTFATVTAAGDTQASKVPCPAGVPAGLETCDACYDITTTATVSGDVQVCVNYTTLNACLSGVDESELKLLHQEGASLVDVTNPGSPDVGNNILCGTANSLSVFAVARPEPVVGDCPDWAFAFGPDYSETDFAAGANPIPIVCRNIKNSFAISLGATRATAGGTTTYTFSNALGEDATRPAKLIITDEDGVGHKEEDGGLTIGNRATSTSDPAELSIRIGADLPKEADGAYFAWDDQPGIGGDGFYLGYVSELTGDNTFPATPAGETCPVNEAFVIEFGVAPPERDFGRGDANGDGRINVTDPVWIIQIIIGNFTKVYNCDDALDADDNGAVELVDAVEVLKWLFEKRVRLPDPFLACGTDPTDDGVSCVEDSPACGG